MRIALKQAQEAFEDGEIPVGAIMVRDNEILAKDHNRTQAGFDVTAHAEILCLTAATSGLDLKYLPDCTLYVTLEPCPMCAGALAWAQLGKLVYGANDVRKGFTLYSPSLLHPKTEVVSGVLEPQCGALLKSFFERKRG